MSTGDTPRLRRRRVPAGVLGGLDGDEAAREVIAEQDQTIAEKSGRSRLTIDRLVRAKGTAGRGRGG